MGRQKSGFHFSPREDGFQIVVGGDRDMTVFSTIARGGVGFRPRSILKRNAQINPEIARRARDEWRARPMTAAGPEGARFGVDTPPVGGPVPPPPPVDPNFDCAAALDPGANGDASTGCYPIPARRH